MFDRQIGHVFKSLFAAHVLHVTMWPHFINAMLDLCIKQMQQSATLVLCFQEVSASVGSVCSISMSLSDPSSEPKSTNP
jgi:hypothetical protein